MHKKHHSLYWLAIITCVMLGVCLSSIATLSQTQTKKTSGEEDIVKVNSNLVNLDVTVKDKKGKVVRDLKPEDFIVTENGVPQKIEFFDATLNEAGPTQATVSPVPNTQPQPDLPPLPRFLPRNVVALVLDGQTTETTNLKAVREGMIKYVRESITNNDSVALFAITGGLQLLQPFTQDKEKLLAAIDRAGNVGTSAKTAELRDLNENIAKLRDELQGAPSLDSATTQAGGSNLLQVMLTRRVLENYIQFRTALSVQQARPILAALAAICEGLRPMRGKKTLVMFSQGFIAPEVLDWQIQSTIDIANRANVTVYIIDSTGLKGGVPQSSAVAPPSALSGISAAVDQESRIRASAGESVFDISRHEGLNRQQDLLYRISEDTGGHFIKNTNDIAAGLNRIDNEIRARYTLAYRSTDQNFDGRFRKVKIEVRRPGLNVVARPGYFAIQPSEVVLFSPEDKKLLANFSAIEANSTLPLSLELIPFRVPPDSYIVPLMFDIPPESVTFEEKAGKRRLQLEVLGLLKREGEDKILSRVGGNFNVELTPQQYDAILNDRIFYRQDIELEAGSYNLELLVKDRLSEKVVAKRERLKLPAFDSQFWVTTPMLSRRAAPYTKPLAGPIEVLSAGNVQITPSPSRVFRATDNLIVFFRLYNAALMQGTNKPVVKVIVSLMKDGKLASKRSEFDLTEMVGDHLDFARFIKLTGLAPGKYKAVVESIDLVAGKALKRDVAFEIVQ